MVRATDATRPQYLFLRRWVFLIGLPNAAAAAGNLSAWRHVSSDGIHNYEVANNITGNKNEVLSLLFILFVTQTHGFLLKERIHMT